MQKQPLANAELAVMDLLWNSSEPLTARQIRENIYSDAAKAQHGTVQRLLSRLEEKGYVTRDQRLPVHLFAATLTQQSYACNQLESLAEKLTGGSFAPLITTLVEQNRLPQSEIEQLRKVLDTQQ